MDSVVQQIRQELKNVQDPELHFSIVDLGLIYDIQVTNEQAKITMTLTSPACPAQDQLRTEIIAAAKQVPGITEVILDLTFTPIWQGQMATPELQQQFALMGIPLTRL